VKTAI